MLDDLINNESKDNIQNNSCIADILNDSNIYFLKEDSIDYNLNDDTEPLTVCLGLCCHQFPLEKPTPIEQALIP